MEQLKLFAKIIKDNDFVGRISDDWDCLNEDDDVTYNYIYNSNIYRNMRYFIEDKLQDNRLCKFEFEIAFKGCFEYKSNTIEYWSKQSYIPSVGCISIMVIIQTLQIDSNLNEKVEFDHEDPFKDDILLTFDITNVNEEQKYEILKALKEKLSEFDVDYTSSYKRV